jgi:uncharacterized protein
MTEIPPLSRPLILLIRGYQRWISPMLPPVCRFYPSCSQYAVEAITAHGPLRGVGLAVRRLLRCHPWHPGGLDPVPPPRSGTSDHAGRSNSAGPDAPAPEERAPC